MKRKMEAFILHIEHSLGSMFNGINIVKVSIARGACIKKYGKVYYLHCHIDEEREFFSHHREVLLF